MRNFVNVDPVTLGPIVPDTITAGTYTILLATVPEATSALDPVLDNNLNPDPSQNQVFFVGHLDQAVNDSFTIATTPANDFTYDPSQGNLLMEIQSAPDDPTNLNPTVFLDVNSNSNGLFSSAFDTSPNPSGCNGFQTSCVDTNSGLVVQFEQSPVPVPEPPVLWFSASFILVIGRRLGRQRQDV